jgi:hypothetical protein
MEQPKSAWYQATLDCWHDRMAEAAPEIVDDPLDFERWLVDGEHSRAVEKSLGFAQVSL